MLIFWSGWGRRLGFVGPGRMRAEGHPAAEFARSAADAPSHACGSFSTADSFWIDASSQPWVQAEQEIKCLLP